MKATLVVIENDADHKQALALLERLMASTAPEDRARTKAQAQLIESYERSRWPVREAAVADVLSYLMEQHGLSRTDLVPLFGSRGRVSEVLSGKREPSMAQIRKLRERFNVSADLFIPRDGRVPHAAE
ncbi:MAG TPA: helix-turn-helix domain-containing protein [Rhizomicrobium sp.]|jgi:HTH-type transcriptional regulator/antitoxin HigA|nr:helix-turn-helix domain-containing protein [Rhizomicrobium sp.]